MRKHKHNWRRINVRGGHWGGEYIRPLRQKVCTLCHAWRAIGYEDYIKQFD